ncbi:MAG: tyrosine-type recombinase/integrase [Syntrophales bacterium]|nr:tyrosine-type recombinase/integrase [Syntrophales bacterium]
MISTIRPKSHQKYLALPVFGPFLDDFTQWSYLHGYTLGTIRNQLKGTRQIIVFLQKQGLQSIGELTHCDFEKACQHFRQDRPAIASTVRRLQKFLEEKGELPLLFPTPKTRSDKELEHFAAYLKNVRGLSDTTIQSHRRYLGRFLKQVGFDTNEQALPLLTLKQIEDFICACSRNLNRYSLQHVVGYLRAFLRFEYGKGILQSQLHKMIDTPRVYRLEKIPHSLPWSIVNNLLNSINRTDTQGIRNYAMLRLITTYGLRSCEVVSLALDDINWRAGTVHILQGKTENNLVLPLTDDVGQALIDYLTRRPELPYREIFLRIRAPGGPLKPTAVSEVFQRQVRLSGLDIPYQGPHCLRHSYAVHLLRHGTSVKVIGDILGHRNPESTCVYLRLATDDLRGVALEVPHCIDDGIRINIKALNDLPTVRWCKGVKLAMPLQSFITEDIKSYLHLHRSLGKEYRNEENTLHSLDSFLATQSPWIQKLDGKIFSQWCDIFAHLSPTVRRNRMRIVRNLCLYRRRSHQHSFVPDILTFPKDHSQFIPYILSSLDIARLLRAAQLLPAMPQSPLRPQTMRLAIALLYTSGLRRGELLRLTFGDFDAAESTLFIRSTKFHKERIIPLSATTDAELRTYLNERQRCGLSMKESSPIIWNNAGGAEGRAYTGTGLAQNWRLLCASLKILTSKGIPPRIHDIRHSFAVNALLRWYHNGENVLAKLPQLSTYMGHVSVVSTQCYLLFAGSLRSVASARFEQKYGNIITDDIEAPKPCSPRIAATGGA